MDLNKAYLEVTDIMEILGYKEGKCYRIIAELNLELQKQGYRTITARVPAEYFCKRYGIKPNSEIPFLMKEDVMAITGFGERLTYKIIRELNSELKRDGLLTHSARVLTEKFCKAYHINAKTLR